MALWRCRGINSEIPKNKSNHWVKPHKYIIVILPFPDPSMSAEAMAYKIGISSRAVEKHISKFRSMGILSREGADHGGYWRIIVNPQTEQ